MKTIELGAHRVDLYHSMLELPKARHHAVQQYLVRAAGIGTSFADVEQHFAKLAALVAAAQDEPQRLPEAADELANLHYNLQQCLARFSPRDLAFACFVARVDGQPCDDLEATGLQALLDRLSGYGLTEAHVAELLESLKKDWPGS